MMSITILLVTLPVISSQHAQAETGEVLLTINNLTPVEQEYFGWSAVVTTDGNILIGGYQDDLFRPHETHEGFVYLFDGSDGSLLLTLSTPTPVDEYEYFGNHIAVTNDGNILISGSSSVYLFDGTLRGITSTPLLTINSPSSNDYFGNSIAVTTDGNILVGAYRDDTGDRDTGSVYLFDGTLRGTTSTPLLTINNPTPVATDIFGEFVTSTTDGNILVGASQDNTGGTNVGSVYLFDGTLRGTTSTPLLTINNPTPVDFVRFGYSITSTTDGNILVGSNGYSISSPVYLFDGTLRGTTSTPLLTINDPVSDNSNNHFGHSIAVTTDGNILVGADTDDTVAYDAGAAYLFNGTDGHLLLTLNSPTSDSYVFFGNSITGTTDGNILVGAYREDTSVYDAGVVYLFEGISTSTPTPIITSILADDPDDLDEIYSTNDMITITFDSDTNIPGGTGIQDKTAIDDLFTFTDALGEYTGLWNATDTFVITITNTTGASPPIIGTTTVTPAGITLILSADDTSEPSTITSPVLSGDFGIIELFCGQPESFYNVINGTESPDYLLGTNSPDLILGHGGNDMIKTRGDNNCIYAGDGNDFVLATNNGNTVYGGAGDDSIQLKGTGIAYGEDGDDTIYIMEPSTGHLIDGGDDSDLCVTNRNQPINSANCEIITH